MLLSVLILEPLVGKFDSIYCIDGWLIFFCKLNNHIYSLSITY